MSATLGAVQAPTWLDWMTEPEATKWSYERVRPDGFGEWHEDGRPVEFFLELDRGTDTLARLAEKLPG